MNTYPDDPLNPEERELARLTGGLGPHGEPSPALDARILAAARKAVAARPARSSRPHWPVAMGLAASVVFAIGIAWQLRPLQQAATMSEAPAAYSRIEAAAPAAAPPDDVPASGQAAAEAVAADTSREATASPEAATARTSTPGAEPPPVPAAPRLQHSRPLQAASPPAPAVRESRQDGYSARASAPPPPPSPPAPAAPVAEPAPTFVPDAAADAAMRPEAAGSQGALRAANAAAAKQYRSRDEAKAGLARETESSVLDRVEVTGSRLKRTDLQVPVSEDAQLAVEEWLERVRTRYGLGDAGAAKQSLLLFVKDHPGEPIPGDLEPLLEE